MKKILVAILALVMLCSVALCTPASATLKVGTTTSDETMSATLTCSANGTLS